MWSFKDERTVVTIYTYKISEEARPKGRNITIKWQFEKGFSSTDYLTELYYV